MLTLKPDAPAKDFGVTMGFACASGFNGIVAAHVGVMIKVEHISLATTHFPRIRWISKGVGIMSLLSRSAFAPIDYQDAARGSTIMVTALGGSARGISTEGSSHENGFNLFGSVGRCAAIVDRLHQTNHEHAGQC